MNTPTADLRNRDFGKILLIKLSAVGDVVHTIPVLNKLRRRYPAAQLDWLVTPAIAELLRHHPAISNVIEFEREDWSTPWRLTPFISYARLAVEAAKDRLRSGDRHARAVPHRDLHARDRRAGADRIRPAARERLGRLAAKVSRRKRASMPGRARARAAGSPTRITSRCPRSTCMRSTVISASGRCSASTTAPPIFPFRFRGEAMNRIDALLRLLRRREQEARRAGARHDLGNQAMAQRRLRRSGAPFPATKALP